MSWSISRSLGWCSDIMRRTVKTPVNYVSLIDPFPDKISAVLSHLGITNHYTVFGKTKPVIIAGS